MTKSKLYKIIAPLIYLFIYLLNKFIIKVTDVIYIVAIIIAIGFLLGGIFLSQKELSQNRK